MAFRIIRHAFSMIFGNFGQALRVSIGPYILLIMLIVAVIMVVGPSMTEAFPEPDAFMAPPEFSLTLFLALAIALVAFLFVFAWVAVSWHRFILLEEYSGILPAIGDRPIWPYVGRSMLYALVIFLVAIPLFLIVGLIATPFTMSGTGIGAALIVFVIAAAILGYVWFRIALALPAVAVGQPITMGQAWAASSAMKGTIFGVSLLLMGINGLAGVLTEIVSGLAPVIGVVLEIFVQWLTLMLGVSILTTLYGHLIEKRTLID
ncbi:MAG: hypothetical protein AAFU41_16175 [Pseudomonadota bacterium]